MSHSHHYITMTLSLNSVYYFLVFQQQQKGDCCIDYVAWQWWWVWELLLICTYHKLALKRWWGWMVVLQSARLPQRRPGFASWLLRKRSEKECGFASKPRVTQHLNSTWLQPLIWLCVMAYLSLSFSPLVSCLIHDFHLPIKAKTPINKPKKMNTSCLVLQVTINVFNI